MAVTLAERKKAYTALANNIIRLIEHVGYDRYDLISGTIDLPEQIWQANYALKSKNLVKHGFFIGIIQMLLDIAVRKTVRKQPIKQNALIILKLMVMAYYENDFAKLKKLIKQAQKTFNYEIQGMWYD